MSTSEAPDFVFGVHEKERFFGAVAQVHSLRELHMHQWESFVGQDDTKRCVGPLLLMPKLKIFVPTVKNNAAFPSSLTFLSAGI